MTRGRSIKEQWKTGVAVGKVKSCVKKVSNRPLQSELSWFKISTTNRLIPVPCTPNLSYALKHPLAETLLAGKTTWMPIGKHARTQAWIYTYPNPLPRFPPKINFKMDYQLSSQDMLLCADNSTKLWKVDFTLDISLELHSK